MKHQLVTIKEGQDTLDLPTKELCIIGDLVITQTQIAVNHELAKIVYFVDHVDGKNVTSFATLEEATAKAISLMSAFNSFEKIKQA